MLNTTSRHPGQNGVRKVQRNKFFKSIGLEIPFLLGFGRGQGEAPKKVIDTTRQNAIARCGVHILPITVSILIITLNCGHTYLGRTIPGSILDPSINIAFLQVVAKIQELAIVASVTTVVIHVLRSELVDGEGIPLGLLGGGFMFTGLSYFWSPEFWGSTYTKYSWTAKTKVYGILILGGIIAAMAGPSTAVLLIPEEQPWPAGGTSIFLPGSMDQLTPPILELDSRGQDTYCALTDSINSVKCPSGGYSGISSIKHDINVFRKPAFTQSFSHNITTGFSFAAPLIHVPSSFGLLPTLDYKGVYRGLACETSMRGPRTLEIMYQRKIMLDWAQEAYSIPYEPFRYGPTLVEYKYYGTMAAVVDSRLPAVRIACTPAQNITRSTTTVPFPVLSKDSCWSTSRTRLVTNTIRANASYSDQLRSTWVSLPPGLGVASSGLVLEMPWDKASSSRPVVGCSIVARWTDGRILTSEVWSSPTGSFTDGGFVPVVSTSLLTNPESTLFGHANYSEFRPVTLSPSTQSTILKESWLTALTPILSHVEKDGVKTNHTTLEKLLTDVELTDGLFSDSQTITEVWNAEILGEVNRTVALEWWLALFITDGMARTGSVNIINTTGPVTSWNLVNYEKRPDFQQRLFAGDTALFRPNTTVVESQVRITISGYSYMANTITDWLAVTLLILHIVLATSHTIYCISTGHSSGAWDTLTELLILMQNSPVAPTVLGNTNAGVKDILTYSHRGRIYATKPASNQNDSSELNNVELIFDDISSLINNKTINLPGPESTNVRRRAFNTYQDHFHRRDRSTSADSRRSRADSTTSMLSKAPQIIQLKRLRSNSGASETATSSAMPSQGVLLSRVRPGVVYGHSPMMIGSVEAFSAGPVDQHARQRHQVNNSVASRSSESQQLMTC